MKKIFSILFALVLAVSLILVPATVSTAATVDYNAAVIKAADRLAATQNDDGGFDWHLDTDPASGSADNCLGISAMGILKAYELEQKATYETALAKAYDYVVETPPTWSFTEGEWEEFPKGVNSWPDVTFLVWLAEAAAEDASLLEAIQTLKSGTTASGIADLARTLWDDRVDYMGDRATLTDPSGTATLMAEYFREIRGYPDCIPWDLEAAVKAALALNVYFPGEGYGEQAAEIAEVIYDSLYVTTYFDINEPAQEGYIHGVTGALEAFVEVDLHSEKVPELKDILLDYQEEDGYWNWHDPVPGNVVESVQDTAYAIMALVRQGDADAMVAAQNGAVWLVSTQLTEGGWYGEGGNAPELPEVDSEAAWALKTMRPSSAVDLSAIVPVPPEEQIGISVDQTAIGFGSINAGDSSAPRMITVTNIGNVAEDFSASLTNISTPDVYTMGLEIGEVGEPPGVVVSEWEKLDVASQASEDQDLILTVPSGAAPGTYRATLVFWAEAS